MIDMLFDTIPGHLFSIDWEGPAMFAIIVMTILAVFRQWHIVLITLFTFVLAWGAQDLIIMNLATNMTIVNVPLIVYCVGGGIALILSLITFLKMAL